MNASRQEDLPRLLKVAFWVSMLTIFYHLLAGTIAVYYGLADDTLALFGFGIASLVEVLSGIGIAYTLNRWQQQDKITTLDRFEAQVQQLTGLSFYLLSLGIFTSALLALYVGEQPDTTEVGIILAGPSLIFLFFLTRYQRQLNETLASDLPLWDARYSRTSLVLAGLLLLSSILYHVFGLPNVDAFGSLVIAWVAARAGRFAFAKAKSLS